MFRLPSPFFHFPYQLFHFCIVSSSSGWSHAFSQSAASNSATTIGFQRPFLLFDLIFFVRSFLIFIFYFLLISSSSVESSCKLCRRCRLYSLNEATIAAQHFSPPFSNPVLLAPSFSPPFQRKTSVSVSLSFAVLDLVFV